MNHLKIGSSCWNKQVYQFLIIEVCQMILCIFVRTSLSFFDNI